MTEKVTIIDVIKKEEANYSPILVDFQNGTLNESNSSKDSFIVAKNKITKKNEGICAINNNVYHGVVKSNEDGDVNTFIAVKRGNKIRLIEVDQLSLVHEVYSEKTESIDIFSNKEIAKRILMKNFGGRKAKLLFERTERCEMNLDVIKKHLDKTIDDTIIEENEEVANEEDLIPPFNKNATEISNIYSLTDILSEEFLNSLKEEAVAVKNFETKELPISSEFIKKEIERVKNIKDETECHTLLKVLIYLDGLLNYIKSKKRNLYNVDLSQISDKITNDISHRFLPKNSAKLIRTSTSVDRAICYFFVLTLLIQPKFELDINILTEEIGRTKAKVVRWCNICHIKTKRWSDILTFELPSKTTKKLKNLKRKTF